MMMSARTESGDKLTSEDLQEEVDTFMFAGHDTNAMALSWTLYLLGRFEFLNCGKTYEVRKILRNENTKIYSCLKKCSINTNKYSKLFLS